MGVGLAKVAQATSPKTVFAEQEVDVREADLILCLSHRVVCLVGSKKQALRNPPSHIDLLCPVGPGGGDSGSRPRLDQGYAFFAK